MRNTRWLGGSSSRPDVRRSAGRAPGAGVTGVSACFEKCATSCGSSSSKIAKSSSVRSVMGRPDRSSTRTSIGTSVMPLRNAGTCGRWVATAAAETTSATPSAKT